MPPLEYLSPFLDVIKSPETSGPITAVALTSMHRFLERDTLGAAAAGGLRPAIERAGRLGVHTGLIFKGGGRASRQQEPCSERRHEKHL